MDYFYSLGQQKNFHAPARNIKAFIWTKTEQKKKPTACGEIAVLKDMIYLQAENPIDLAKNRE